MAKHHSSSEDETLISVIITYCLHFLETLNCLLFMYFCVNLMKEFRILLFISKKHVYFDVYGLL